MKKLLIHFTVIAIVSTGTPDLFAMNRVDLFAINQAWSKRYVSHSQLFKCYVAIGDSLTEGFMGIGVDETRQPFCFPNQLAKKMKTDFVQPPFKFPGYYINIEDVAKGNIEWYEYFYLLIGGRRIDDYDNQEMLNNFGVTGADVTEALEKTGQEGGFFHLVLGEYGKPLVEQALDREPTFVTIFLGNNDLLGAVVECNVKKLTSLKKFKRSYARLVCKVNNELRENGGTIKGVAIANLPDISCIAYLEAARSPSLPRGTLQPFFLYRPTETLNLKPCDLWKIKKRHRAFNRIIKEAAVLNGWAFVDVNKTFLELKAHGRRLIRSNGRKTYVMVDAAYLGGVFSLDGVHPSIIGSAVMANEFIGSINKTYGTQLGFVDEYQAARHDTLFTNPYDPRVYIDRWVGRSLYYLLDLFT